MGNDWDQHLDSLVSSILSARVHCTRVFSVSHTYKIVWWLCYKLFKSFKIFKNKIRSTLFFIQKHSMQRKAKRKVLCTTKTWGRQQLERKAQPFPTAYPS